MSTYDFDTVIDRFGTQSEKWDVEDGQLPMWVADMDFRTAPGVIDALMKRTSHGIFGYSGIPDEWYEAYISWWKNRHDFVMEKDWLIFCNGVVPAISSLIRKLTTPAEKIIVETPVYNIFFNSIVNNGRAPVQCPLLLTEHGYTMDLNALEKACADPQVTMLLLCNPQNPGGKIWDKETLVQVAEICDKHGVTVISDEIHCDLTDPGRSYVPFASVSATARRISVTCLSPSKAFNVAGMHSAAVVCPNENLRHRVYRCLNNDEIAEPNCYAVNTAIACYTKGGEWLDALRQYLYDNKMFVKEYLQAHLPAVECIPEDATYLVWIRVSSLKNEGSDLVSFLRESTGLILCDGSQYGEAGNGYVRLNTACPRSVLKDGLQRFVKGVQMYQR